MKSEELAAELIELCCGAHSVGMLRFLLKLNNHTEATAREEFVKFLAGELSDRLLDDARQWVAAEQACREDRAVAGRMAPRGQPQAPGVTADGEKQAGVGVAAKLLDAPSSFSRRFRASRCSSRHVRSSVYVGSPPLVASRRQ